MLTASSFSQDRVTDSPGREDDNSLRAFAQHGVGAGAAGCWSINNLGPRIIRRDFALGFIVEHFIKDMGIALAEAKAMGLTLVKRLYRDLSDAGGGRDGTQALMKVPEKMQ